MTATKRCRHCGAPFPASRADFTVHCPEHRGRRPAAAARPEPVIRTCRCGKTVIEGPGVLPGSVTCPRGC